MAHRNYHEVQAETPRECGQKLGKLFGHHIHEYLEEAREEYDWPQAKRNAAPLLAATSRHFPSYIEELQGYAEAARLSLDDLWAIAIEDELDDDDDEHCTTVVTNGGKLISHNEDWADDAEEAICILKKTCAGRTSLELYYYGTPLGGTALAIGSNGFVQAINSLNHSDWQVGVPKVVIARRLSEIRDAGKELQGVLAIPRSSGFTHNLISRQGQLTAVECTAQKHGVRSPGLPYVHTNHYLDRDLCRFEDGRPSASTLKRHEAASRLACPAMDLQSLVSLSSDASAGKTASVFNRDTIARAIVDLDNQSASIWLRREDQRGWIDYPIDFI
jgi:Acyl-coenzyme A:6-aminopenicillanic acid acyl-transferase